jgi:UDP-N-acetylmuramoyl-L-alanyl-D-glutamate--2,6-diaminopimelate ligase
VLVTGVTHDSTRVRPGDLYVAIKGGTRHGAEFADRAVAAGALAVLTDEAGASLVAGQEVSVPVLVVDEPRAVLGAVAALAYGDPTRSLRVIGITGTAGKTSTAYLIESGLAAAGHTTCMVGTVETRIADRTIDSVRTTPEATDLHALFATALERGATAAVMEVSSHALAYGRVGGVHFDVGGFSNFGQDHLDFHTDVADYFAAKAKLFDGRCRVEVLNLDDPALTSLLKAGQVTFSAAGDPAATWRAEQIVRTGFAQTFRAVRGARHLTPSAASDGNGDVVVRVAMPGHHNVANALLALACLVEAGVPPQVAADGIGACRGVPGRLELVGAAGPAAGASGLCPVLGVVDYAHKPDAIVAALAALRDVVSGEARPGRVICVIGAGGDRDRGKRPLMGSAAAEGADVVLVTDDNPRSEDPAVIRAEVLAGATGRAEIVEVAGRRPAIDEAVRLAEPGDVIAVLGKGHERGQEVGGVIMPFDDRVELAAALAARFLRVTTA